MELGIGKESVAYIGNDINDMEVMKSVGVAIAPSDAHSDIKRIAKFVTEKKQCQR